MSTLIGVISAIVSIGGGSLTVPYLAYRNVPIKQAIGTSAALGLPISLAGTLGYIYNGPAMLWLDQMPLTLGYILFAGSIVRFHYEYLYGKTRGSFSTSLTSQRN